ncbi:MAG TPA: hypothetical protein PLB96_13820 [Syntrophales bacterium]|nr:hypothetical protein [Syntrophales bacterium]
MDIPSIEKIRENILKIDDPFQRQLTIETLNQFGISLISPNEAYTGASVKGFYLEKKYYRAESFIDILREIIGIMVRHHGQDIDKILTIKGPKRKYFSKDKNDIHTEEKIRGTNIYFEKNDNAKTLAMRCEKILKLFGHDYVSFKIEIYR